MRELQTYIEIDGEKVYVGNITGNSPDDASFRYSGEYLSMNNSNPISVSLPLREDAFAPEKTKSFFEGLLPEGYTRRSVAEWMRVDESDYLSILSGLGRECIGAIQVIEENSDLLAADYRELSINDIKELAAEGAAESTQMVTESHLSLAGASGKVGLYLSKDNKWFLPIGDAPSTHIVKQSHIRLDNIIMNERLVMLTAGLMGLSVPDSFIINTGDGSDSEVLFATNRFDRALMSEREIKGNPCPFRLHQEDFAQALGVMSKDKYEKPGQHHFRDIADILRFYSADPISDIELLWDITVFNWLIGNTDNHIKNISILYSSDFKSFRLAPAYDLVSTAVYKGTTRDMAFNIGGQYRLEEIGIKEWKKAATEIGINATAATDKIIEMRRVLSDKLKEAAEKLCSEMTNDADDEIINAIHRLADRILESGGISKV